MAVGYDVAPDSRGFCAVRELPEQKIAAGCLLFSFGTVPEAIAVCMNGLTEVVKNTAAWCMDAMEKIIQSEGRTDLHYAATHIMDALNQANRQIREISRNIGQGLYVGGVVIYTVAGQYIACAFGGGAVYTMDGAAMTRQANNDSPDGLIWDALGGRDRWLGRFWKGTLRPGSRIFATSEPLAEPAHCANEIKAVQTTDSHPCTNSMILRRAASRNGIDAVLEITI